MFCGSGCEQVDGISVFEGCESQTGHGGSQILRERAGPI